MPLRKLFPMTSRVSTRPRTSAGLKRLGILGSEDVCRLRYLNQPVAATMTSTAKTMNQITAGSLRWVLSLSMASRRPRDADRLAALVAAVR
jgi:hypothetical protein